MARAWFFLVLLNSSSFSATRLSISCLTCPSSSWARRTLFSSCSRVPSASSRAPCSSSFSCSKRPSAPCSPPAQGCPQPPPEPPAAPPSPVPSGDSPIYVRPDLLELHGGPQHLVLLLLKGALSLLQSPLQL